MRGLRQVLDAFLKEDDDDVGTAGAGVKEVVRWEEVKSFLLMTQEVLRSNAERINYLELEAAQHTNSSSAARNGNKEAAAEEEENSFLAGELNKLISERNVLHSRVQELTRCEKSLKDELALIKAQLDSIQIQIPLSPGMPINLSPAASNVTAERAKSAALEKEVAVLKAKLEKLNVKGSECSHSPRIRAGGRPRTGLIEDGVTDAASTTDEEFMTP